MERTLVSPAAIHDAVAISKTFGGKSTTPGSFA